MAKYCDTKELEYAWAQWLISRDTPYLDEFKDTGLIWSKSVDDGHMHVVCTAEPLYFRTTSSSIAPEQKLKIFKATLEPIDPELHASLLDDKYILNVGEKEAWDRLSSMIYLVCQGVSLKFRPSSEEEKTELAHEALKFTLDKIRRDKLRYEPGRAPVFNLVTTAVIRIMYSIKNKENKYLDHQNKLTTKLANFEAMPNFRSLRVSQSVMS